MPCASAADNLLVSALHIVSDKNSPGATLMAWRDFLLLAHVSGTDDVLQRAQPDRTVWVDQMGDERPSSGSLPTPLVEAFADEDPRVPGTRRLKMVMSPGVVSRRSVLNQVFRLPLINALKYLAGLIWPTSDFLGTKVGDVTHPHLRWWQMVVSGGPDSPET